MKLYHSISSTTLAELQKLVNIIQDSLRTINGTLESAGLDFPSIHEPLTMESEAARMIPDVDEACRYIVAAAYQLISSVRSPLRTIQIVATHVKT